MQAKDTATTQEVMEALDRVQQAAIRVEQTGAALLATLRQCDLIELALRLQDVAPCTRPGLIGWIEMKIDDLSERGIPEGMTPAEALKAAYLKWVAH